MALRPEITAVVPSVELGPELPRLLASLRQVSGVEVVLVYQGPETPGSAVLERVDRVLLYPREAGEIATILDARVLSFVYGNS